MEIKEHEMDTILSCGQYTGHTFNHVARVDPSYIYYCLIQHENFYVSDETLEAIRKMHPFFRLAIKKRTALAEALAEKKRNKQLWLKSK